MVSYLTITSKNAMASKNKKTDRFYAGGFLYNQATTSILLHKRDARTKVNPMKWAFFGGLNEGNETPEQTFIREMKEELGIDILEDELQLLCEYYNEEQNTYRYVYFVNKDIEKLRLTLNEGEAYEWIQIEKVFDYDLTDKTHRDLKLFVRNHLHEYNLK